MYSPQRFMAQKLFHLTDLSKLDSFVEQVLNGEGKLWWPSLVDRKPKHSVKIVGTDFENRVFNTNRDALVLFYHPLKDKNRGLKEKYEQFVKL